jgi:hypothetical protein
MPTTYQYDHLNYKGTIKDYSSMQPNDIVRIPASSVLLRPALKSNFENEKSSMEIRAREIGCILEESKNKQFFEIKFIPNEKKNRTK